MCVIYRSLRLFLQRTRCGKAKKKRYAHYYSNYVAHRKEVFSKAHTYKHYFISFLWQKPHLEDIKNIFSDNFWEVFFYKERAQIGRVINFQVFENRKMWKRVCWEKSKIDLACLKYVRVFLYNRLIGAASKVVIINWLGVCRRVCVKSQQPVFSE